MTDRCPICASERTVERYPAQVETLAGPAFSYEFGPEHRKTLRVVRCLACTHQFCSPIPVEPVEHYARGGVDPAYLAQSESRVLAAQAVLKALPGLRPRARLLDVGCATGDLLVAARERDLDASGVELSAWSAAIARERGFAVHEQPLASLEGDARFDVITMIGVIEHFTDPLAELRHVHRLLAPGGVFVGWTGDVASITARVLGRRWWYWQGQHVQYFTRRSLIEALRRTSFDVPRIATYPFAATHATLAHSLSRYRGHRVLTAMLRPAFSIKRIWYLRIPGELLFVAQRLAPTTIACTNPSRMPNE